MFKSEKIPNNHSILNTSVKRSSLILFTRVFQIATLAVIMIQLTILLWCLDIIGLWYPYNHTWGVIFIELSTHLNTAMTCKLKILNLAQYTNTCAMSSDSPQKDSYQFHDIPERLRERDWERLREREIERERESEREWERERMRERKIERESESERDWERDRAPK